MNEISGTDTSSNVPWTASPERAGLPVPPTPTQGAALERASDADAVNPASLTLDGLKKAAGLVRLVRASYPLPEKIDEEAADALQSVGLCTTIMPQHPRPFAAYYPGRGRTWAELDRLRQDTKAQLDAASRANKTATSEDDLIPYQIQDLRDVVDVETHEIQIVNNVTVIGRTILTACDRHHAKRLNAIFQGLFSGELGKLCVVEIGADSHGREAIIIKGMDEYDERAAEAGTWEVLADRYKQITGTIFPPVKSPLAGLEEDGHRFLAAVRQQLVEVRDDYHQKMARFMDLERKAYSYIGFTDERHPRVDQDPLTQTPASLFEIIRKAMRGARPENYAAFEQNPDPDALKSLIAKRSTLTREPMRAQQAAKGPASPSALTPGDILSRWTATMYTNIKEHRWRTIGLKSLALAAKGFGKVTGGILGAVDFAVALASSPTTGKNVKKFLLIHSHWKQLKQEFKAAIPTYDHTIKQLDAKHDELERIHTSQQ